MSATRIALIARIAFLAAFVAWARSPRAIRKFVSGYINIEVFKNANA